MKSVLSLFLLFAACLQPLVAQPKAPKGQTGKCFATCRIPDQYKIETITIPVYTGSEWDNPCVEKVALPPGACHLVKKTNGEISSFCLEYAFDASNRDLWQVMDTIEVRQFELRTIPIGKTLVKQGGYSEWREVLCENSVDKNTLLQIKTGLKTQGYDPGLGCAVDAKVKAALARFQKDRGLPVGNLDFETLGALGVSTDN